jgi:putative ABC transport system permease protein
MLRDLLAESMRNVRAHALRVILTGSGIAWGIALFVVLTAMGRAVHGFYRGKMEAIGRQAVYVFPAMAAKRGVGAVTGRAVVLDRDDPPRVPRTPLVERVSPELPLGGRVLRGGGHIKVVWAYGTGADTGRIRNFEVARGRFITPGDVAARRRVLVIGARVEERLFGRRSALGRTVRLEGHPFRVVGVAVPKGVQIITIGPFDDEQVLMPISTAQTLVTGSREFEYLMYEPRRREDASTSIGRVRALLARPHHFRPDDEEALGFFDVANRIRPVAVIEVALELFLVACGALTLVAGGIGVMNIMLVAVAERTRELGLRKALGASDRDLFVQVLFETVLVTVLAGLAGLTFGGGLVALLAATGGRTIEQRTWVPQVEPSMGLALVAFAALVGVGMLAGIAPARRAARLDPSVALREG